MVPRRLLVVWALLFRKASQVEISWAQKEWSGLTENRASQRGRMEDIWECHGKGVGC